MSGDLDEILSTTGGHVSRPNLRKGAGRQMELAETESRQQLDFEREKFEQKLQMDDERKTSEANGAPGSRKRPTIAPRG